MPFKLVSPGSHPVDKEVMSWLDTHHIRGTHIRGYTLSRGMDGTTELTIVVVQEMVPESGSQDLVPPIADAYIDPDSTAIIERVK